MSLYFVIFYILRPYKIIDQNKTTVTCLTTNQIFIAGQTPLWLFENEPDSYIDQKIKTLCGNIKEKNVYQIKIVYKQELGWIDDISLTSLLLLICMIIMDSIFKKTINDTKNRLLLFCVACLIGFSIFSFFLKKIATKPYCQQKIASQMANFKLSAYAFGIEQIQQESIPIQSALLDSYRHCIKKETIF